jgi:hypothetical protein
VVRTTVFGNGSAFAAPLVFFEKQDDALQDAGKRNLAVQALADVRVNDGKDVVGLVEVILSVAGVAAIRFTVRTYEYRQGSMIHLASPIIQ